MRGRQTVKKQVNKPGYGINVLVKYSSMFELLDRLPEKGPEFTGDFETYNRSVMGNQNEGWAGAEGFDHAKEIMNTYTCTELNQLVGIGNSVSNRFELVPSVSGFFNDVQTYLIGDPECMADFEQVEQNKFIELFIDMPVASTVNLSVLTDKIKQLFEVINGIEMNGTRCKITIGVNGFSRADNKNIQIELIVKDYEDPMNPALHGFILTHPALFRVFLIGVMSKYSNDGGVGTPIPCTHTTGILIDILKDSKQDILNKINN